MYLLGLDIGSSSVKASLLEAQNGKTVASATSSKKELEVISLKTGWLKQNPEVCRNVGIGLGFYKDFSQAFERLKSTRVIEPDKKLSPQYKEAYENWFGALKKSRGKKWKKANLQVTKKHR